MVYEDGLIPPYLDYDDRRRPSYGRPLRRVLVIKNVETSLPRRASERS
jgi:hypothetical protein